jgi:hypothetical protein
MPEKISETMNNKALKKPLKKIVDKGENLKYSKKVS